MKIGIISNLYPPYARGGAENVVVRTVESLLEDHQDVFVISSRPRLKRTMDMRALDTTERVYRFFPKNIYHVLDDYKYSWPVRLLWHIIDALCPCGANKVDEVLTDEHPDAIITHNLKGIGLSIPRRIQKRGIPHVHVVHDLQLIYPSGLLFAGQEELAWYKKPFYWAYRAICRRQLGHPDLVIFPSSYLRDAYTEQGFFQHTRVEVLANPAPDFSPDTREANVNGPLKLLFVGQLEDHKGIRFLLDAFKKMPEDTRLIIAGEGTQSELVKQRAQEDKRITYLGFISLEQLIKCFGIADALIVPSLCYENSPTVIYESLQAGVPVLAADIGGVGELVNHGENGYLFKPGSATELLQVVLNLREHKEEFARSQEEIQRSVAPFALELYRKQLLTMVRQTIDRTQTP